MWAQTATQCDPTSRAKYQALRARGHGHARALRSVVDRLLYVACAMLENRTLFDPSFTEKKALAEYQGRGGRPYQGRLPPKAVANKYRAVGSANHYIASCQQETRAKSPADRIGNAPAADRHRDFEKPRRQSSSATFYRVCPGHRQVFRQLMGRLLVGVREVDPKALRQAFKGDAVA